MTRTMILIGAAWLLGCKGGEVASREHTPPGEQTASASSTGSDSGSRHERIEGTSRGVELEAPRRIPGVMATLGRLTSAGGKPDKGNLTALRGDLGTLVDAMRNDFTRVGLADTGAFHALSDSLRRQLGGGPGSTAQDIEAKELPKLSARVQRLVGIYNDWMARARP